MNFLDKIHSNIQKLGIHITSVKQGVLPRFTYSIGLKEKLGYELIFAGGYYFNYEEIIEIIKSISSSKLIEFDNSEISIAKYGKFNFLEVDYTWSSELCLGVYDYYNDEEVLVKQIIPQTDFMTFDIPNLSKSKFIVNQPIWNWVEENWEYNVSKESIVITNLKALRGEPITEIMRWETNEWEMFAGSGEEELKSNIRILPLASVLAFDKTLLESINLKVGKGMWRDSYESDWNDWG